MRVDRVSDSRFDRSALVAFVDRAPDAEPAVDAMEEEMRFLHQHLFWRIDMLKDTSYPLPEPGEELLVRIPKSRLYLVSR